MTDHSPLSICCFGGLQFIVAGTAVTGFASRKADALFVYLACNPRAHPRETLATLLWPNNDQTRALANLSVALTSLRKQLDNYLAIERHTIGFNSEANSWLDTAVFQHAINQAKEQKQRKGKLSRTGAAQLDSAVSLYKGDFLAGFNIRNAPEFEAWTLLEQERLRQMMITSLADLIAFYQQRGQVSQGIRYAQQLLALDSLQEEAHRDLMRLYVQNNQRPAALAQYQQCATTLANELGVEPDEETTTLYNQLRDEQVTWTPEDLNIPAAKHNLPAAITSFIGREAELAQIDQWLAEPNGRLLTITGPGGMGKTRLAQEAARTQVGNFADGVWHVSLVPLADDGELVTAVAEVIGLVFAATLDPAQQLVSYLVEKEMLLVLDNFEHLVTESSLALLTEILQRTVELKLLVTSRERLNLQAEALLNLRGLPFPLSSKQHSINSEHSPSSNPSAASDQIFHSPISDYPAVQLFSNRAQRLQVDFELDGVATAVEKLCQLVEGLPLALELAATWIRTLTVPEIVTEIERGIDFLATTWRDMPERHRSVRAVCATSWQMLSPVEQDVYSQLSVYRGGFSREAAWQIANASLATLSSLADKSFLRLDGAAGQQAARYRRHPLLIQFAAEQLAQQPEKLAESQQRLAAYLAQALADRADHFYSPKRTAVMVFMTAEHENIRLAWQWALANDPSLLASMATSYQQYLIGTGLFAEGAKQFSLAVSALNQPDQALERARLLIQYCQFARFVGQTEVGRDAVLESLAILDRTSQTENTSDIEAQALRQYGSLLLSDDNKYAEAKKVHEQALTIFRKQNSWVGQGDVLFNLSVNAYYTGQFVEAMRLAEASQALQQRAGNQIGQIAAQQILGLVFTSLGKFNQAIDLFHSCIALAASANYKVDLPWHHADLGYAYLLAGNLEAAGQTLRRCLQYSLECGDPQAISVAYSLLGFVHLHNGRFLEAQMHGQHGLQYSHEPNLHFPFQQAFALTVLGATALQQGEDRPAFEQLTKASDLYRKIEHVEYLGWSLPIQLIAACALRRTRRAKDLIRETAELAQKLDAYMPKLMALLATAVWCCQHDQPEMGIALWAQAEAENLVTQSRWFQAIADRFIRPVAHALSQERLAEARQQGTTQDFMQLMQQMRG